MKIEHVAFQVPEPGKMADWYCQNLGFTVKRASDEPVPVRFIAEEGGTTMLELYNNSKADMPDYTNQNPLTLHLAFVCSNVDDKKDQLVEAGAKLVSRETTPSGDNLAMLKDPWGMSIQLCDRAEPMI